MRHTLTLTAILAAGAAIVLTSCENYDAAEVSGRTGVSHDGNGIVTLHVNTCENSTKHVKVHAGREDLAPDEQNPVIGSYTLDAPRSGSLFVRTHDPFPWSAEQKLALPEDPSHFFIVSSQPEDKGGPRFINPEKYFSSAPVTYDRLMAAPAGAVVTGIDAGLSYFTPEEFDAACPSR